MDVRQWRCKTNEASRSGGNLRSRIRYVYLERERIRFKRIQKISAEINIRAMIKNVSLLDMTNQSDQHQGMILTIIHRCK